MLKIKLLTAATAAALFAIGGAVAQTSTPGTSAGAADRAPTTTTGRPEVGGPKTGAERAKSGSSSSSSSAGSTSSRAATPTFTQIDKNNDGQISRDEWNAYQRSGGAASGATTDVTGGAKRGPTERTGKPETGGPRTGGEKQGSASGGASSSTSPSTGATSPGTSSTSPSTGSTSSGTGTATSPTAPTGEPRVGGSGSTK